MTRIEIEVGIDLIGQARAVEEDGQALLLAELTQHSFIRRLNELGPLRRTGFLERLGHYLHGLIEVGELDFHVCEIDAPELVQL